MTSEILSFGHYGAYIWSAYALSALVLVYNVIAAFRRQRNIERELRAWLASGGNADQ
jgi:heme exporter protein CcmD